MCHYKGEQTKKKKNKNKKNKTKKKTIQTKEQKTKKKNQKRSKPLIAALEEVVKISGITFESYQRGSSV